LRLRAFLGFSGNYGETIALNPPLHQMASPTFIELVNWSGRKGWNKNKVAVVPAPEAEQPLLNHVDPVGDVVPAPPPPKTKRRKGKKSGLYPIHEAAIEGQRSTLMRLLARGAKVNIRRGETKRRKTPTRGLVPLHGAAAVGNVAALKILLNNRADVNVKSENGWSALHFAVRGGHTAAAELLIQHGAAVNAKTSSGDTVLHVAASRFTTDPSTLEVVLRNGADLDATNHENLKAIATATEEVVKVAIREEVERRRQMGLLKEDDNVKHLWFRNV